MAENDPDTPVLPSDILAIIAWPARKAGRYSSRATGEPRLQSLEFNGFKSDLIERPQRWTRDPVPPSAFSEACRAAGLTPDDTAKRVDCLRRGQAGRKLAANRWRKGDELRPRGCCR